MTLKIDGSIRKTPQVGPQKQANSTTFTGATSYTKEITDGLYHAKTIRRMESLKWLKGEIGGILITALGTGLVAPIFIGFNPFVKAPKNATPEEKEENKNTKLYTAMRQPISAALAILFQASVQKYIDKGLDKVFNDPKIAQFARVNLDQSKLNTETRVKDVIQGEMKKEGKKKPSAITALFDKKAKEARNAYKDEFNSRVKARQEEQLNAVAEEFERTGLIKPGEHSMKNRRVAELVNDQIDEYIKEARKLQKSVDKMVPYYIERAEILTSNRKELRKILEPIKNNGSVTVEQLNQLIATYKDTNPKLKNLIQEIKDKPEDLRMHRITRTLDRLDILDEYVERGKLNVERYRKAMLARNTVLDDIISQLAGKRFKNPQAADEKAIQKAIESIAKICDFHDKPDAEKEILKNTNTFGEDFGALKSKVYKDVTKRFKKLVSNNYTSWNQITKIGVGVFITLPITCTALNWVYPRFMEIFFPKLAGVKKPQGDEKVGGDK